MSRDDLKKQAKVPFLKSIQARALVVPLLILSVLGGALFFTLWSFDKLFSDITSAFDVTSRKQTVVNEIKTDSYSMQSEVNRLLSLSLQNLDYGQLVEEQAKLLLKIEEVQRKFTAFAAEQPMSDAERSALRDVQRSLDSFIASVEKAVAASTARLPISHLFMVGVEQEAVTLHADLERLLSETSSVNYTTVLDNTKLLKQVVVTAFLVTLILSLFVLVSVFSRIARNITEITYSMNSIALDEVNAPLPAAQRQDELGQMARALTVFRDNAIALHEANSQLQQEMAARQKIEIDLHKSRALLLDAQELAHLGSWEHDLQTDRWIYSDELFRILEVGRDEGEVFGQSFFNAIHPADRDKLKDAYAAFTASNQKYDIEYRLKLAGNVTKHINERGLVDFDAQGVPIRRIGTLIDITRSKQALEKIHLLSQVVEQSPVSVMIADINARLEYVNAAFERLTGYTSAEVLGHNPRFLKSFKTPDATYEELWEALRAGGTWEGELYNRKKNGETFWEYAHFSAIKDESGAVTHFIAVKEDMTQQKHQEQQIMRQAYYDALTDLPNRLLSLDRLSQLIKEADRAGHSVAVLFIDLDDFKKVNDSLGHEVGDKLLIETAERLKQVVRSGDTVGRLGGDEFLILLGDISEPLAAGQVAENVIEQFKDRPFNIDGRELVITCSVGIALHPKDGNSPSTLLRNADSAMYHAKDAGRNTYSYFTDEMNLEVSRRLALEEQMRGALEREEFYVRYQVQVDLSTGKVMGAEALLRWRNSILGEVTPFEFIPIAEQTGQIIPLGEYVLSEGLKLAKEMRDAGEKDFRIAVNISPRQFRDPSLVGMVKHALVASEVPSDALELEITEGVLMSGHNQVARMLNDLSEMGINIALDDFGTGYSSLSYLRTYPFDVLKVDRSFISDITEDPADCKLVAGTIAMAHGLGLKVVAEGIETEAQKSWLQGQCCDYGQGYLYSKPVSPGGVRQLVADGVETI